MLKNWEISGVFAVIYFIIFFVVEMLARYAVFTLTDLEIIIHGGMGAFVFFIWCWFILSLWRKEKEKSKPEEPVPTFEEGK